MEKERDHTKFIIQRFDTYISGANTKGNFLLAFNIFVVGASLSNYNRINNIANCNERIIVSVLLVLLVIVSLVAIYFIIKAVYPFLASGNSTTDKYHSHIFFNSVAEFQTPKAYYESYSKQTDSDVDEDLCRQAFQIAQALKTKYRLLDWSIRFIYGELFILFGILLIVIFY